MDRALAAPTRRRPSTDGGFSLVEVVVALFLLSMVASAVLVFFVRGMQASAHLQRAQAADQVAMEAMEKVRTVSPQAANGLTSSIILGRTADAVNAAWVHAGALADANSTPAFDSNAGPSSSQTIPITTTVKRAGINYTVTTLIGACYRLATGVGADQPCTVGDPGGGVAIYRATVIVTWKATSTGQCDSTGQCSYTLSALIDPSVDATWNLTTNPVAYDDDFGTEVFAGNTVGVDIPVMSNDIIGPVTANPIQSLSTPGRGTVTTKSVTDGTTGVTQYLVHYTPTSGSGIDTFTYKLRDNAGRVSNEAIVTITVRPVAKSDTVTVYAGVKTVIDVLTGSGADLGSFGGTSKVTIVSDPTGRTSASGTTVTFNGVGSTAGNTYFTYTVTDASGVTSVPGPAATVTVRIATPANPVAADLAYAFPTSATLSPSPLGILSQPALAGNGGGSTVVLVSAPVGVGGWSTPGTVTSDAASTDLTYTRPAGSIGVYSFTYKVVNAVGTSSAVKKVTITVTPFAASSTLSLSRRASSTVDFGALSIPTDGTGNVYAIVAPSPTCGTASIVAATGVMKFTAGSAVTSCTVSYSVTNSAGSPAVTSSGSLAVTVK